MYPTETLNCRGYCFIHTFTKGMVSIHISHLHCERGFLLLLCVPAFGGVPQCCLSLVLNNALDSYFLSLRELVLSCCSALATSQLGALRNIVCESLLAPGGKRVSDSVYFSSWNCMGMR